MNLVDAALVDFIYLVFTRMPGCSYYRGAYKALVDYLPRVNTFTAMMSLENGQQKCEI